MIGPWGAGRAPGSSSEQEAQDPGAVQGWYRDRGSAGKGPGSTSPRPSRKMEALTLPREDPRLPCVDEVTSQP